MVCHRCVYTVNLKEDFRLSSRLLIKAKNMAKRIHTHVPAGWLKVIDAAAKQQGITRANFMATASHAAAEKVLAKAAVK